MSLIGERDPHSPQIEEKDDKNCNCKEKVDGAVSGDSTDPNLYLAILQKDEREREGRIKRLYVAGDAPDNQAAMRKSILKLIQIRSDLIPQNRICRRAAWKEEIRKEAEQRTEFKSKMEAVPLEEVKNWKDKQSMAKVSVGWREALKDERTTFLFQDVYSILFEKDYLNITDMLGCRPVCKTWRDSFDNCFSESSSSSFIRQIGLGSASASSPSSEGQLLCTGSLTAPIDPSIENSSNPFLTRKLQLGRSGIHWKGREAYLTRWGGEIRSVIFELEKGGLEFKYLHLIKYLRLMPNLRELLIHDKDDWSNEQAATRKRDLAKDMSSLKERMEGNPFPKLPHLHSIVFAEFIPAPLIHSALRAYSGSLEAIAFCMEETVTNPWELLGGCDFPKLKFLGSDPHFSFPAPCHLTCPFLEELQLSYDCFEGGDSSIMNLFGALNNCGSTLRRLDLNLDSGPPSSSLETKLSDKVLRSLFLELPRLEILELFVSDLNLENIDFLLPCSSLKIIGLLYLKTVEKFAEKSNRRESPAAPPNEIIQFTGYRDHLYDSNIWNLFPQLGRVIVALCCKLKEGQGREPVLRCGKNVSVGHEKLPKDTDSSGGIYTREEYQRQSILRFLQSMGVPNLPK